jgi:alpha-mannosidase
MEHRFHDPVRRRLAQMAVRLLALARPEAVAPDRLLVSERTGRIGWDAAQELTYRGAELGQAFGPQWATYWFRVEATIPESWAGACVELAWDSGSEATLWRDGEPLQGLNAGATARRTEARLTDAAAGGERVAVAIEMACNSWMGAADAVRLERCGLVRFDPEAWETAWDFEALRQLEAEPDLEPAMAGHLLAELNRFCAAWDTGDRAAAREILAGLLAHGNPGRVHRMTAIGHAHLDTAWLWPLAESRRKVIRSFANQLALMDRYPEHRFAASSAQHYAWLQEDAPSVFARVRERAREGRWEVVGGAWVEPDCNLPSGESLVRQLLYGQRAFEGWFGRRCREYWSPDTFGHNGQMPQILRGAGIDRFMTQKLSWNQFTSPPHHSFRWEGIDGSAVLAHFPPADTYNAHVTIPELRAAAARYRDHDRSASSLLVFGHGDGGGGPAAEMLELTRRARDLQGVPQVEVGTSDAFFSRLGEELIDPPTLVGELYFEYHRGTYTSQARTKRGNRTGERLLHEAEAAAALACRLRGAEYPADELRALWRTLLLNQFHDILPGSSIREVYEDAERDHAAVAAGAARLRDAAVAALGEPGADPAPLNLAPFPRREVTEDPAGRLVMADAPAYGFGEPVEPDDGVRADGLVLENGHLRAELDAAGRLLSLVDRATGRETLAGPGNVLELSADRPAQWDAWELEPYYADTRRATAGAHHHEVVAGGPLRAEIAFEHRIGGASTVRQVVRLDAGARRLEFRTTIEWAERHALLQVAFPLLVRAATAAYEMQFGVATRPTHVNTAADLAQFEVPGHRFGDLSEHGFGVALLTDSTYGFSARGNELRLSLLRGPTEPDPEADLGSHELAYAVFPHAGGWQAGGVVAEARRFNEPILWAPGGPPGAAEADGLVLDTIKRAEDSDALVLRLYEPHGARGTAHVRLAFPFTDVRRSNLLEDRGEPLPVSGDTIEIPYRPFELVTILID